MDSMSFGGWEIFASNFAASTYVATTYKVELLRSGRVAADHGDWRFAAHYSRDRWDLEPGVLEATTPFGVELQHGSRMHAYARRPYPV